MISDEGYTLSLASRTAAAGPGVPVTFRILGPDGRAVTAYETTHDKDLHLIAVRRDLTGYQHIHPVLSGDGTWSAPVDLEPGQWRVFADFTPEGSQRSLTLGADLAVAGDHTPRPLPEPSRTAEVDGYEVRLDGGLVPGRASLLTLTVTRDGTPVTDLEPYLGAYGHLVTLRDGDLAYLHVHPAGDIADGTAQPGPDIAFYATAPSAGTYRLFLDFQHDGVVRTAELTARAEHHAEVPEPAESPGPAESADHSDAHGH